MSHKKNPPVTHQRVTEGKEEVSTQSYASQNSISESEQNVNDFASKYKSLNYSVIPLQPNSKIPIPHFPWGTYQHRLPSEKEISEWFNGTENNIAIVTGTISGLVVIDADTAETIEFLESNFSVLKQTAQVITKRGKHYYFRISDLPDDFNSQKIYEGNIKIDLKANGGYVVAPPSSIDTHKYTWVSSDIKKASFKEFQVFLHEIKNKVCKYGILTTLESLILEIYEEGVRQDICLSTAGLLRHLGFSESDAEGFIQRLCLNTGDKDVKQRTSTVSETWKKDLKSIKGFSGLVELGIDREKLAEIVKKVKPTTPSSSSSVPTGFTEKDGILYEEVKGGVQMVGPSVEIIAKILNDKNEIAYELAYNKKTFIISEIQDVETIRKNTGIAIIKEKRFLEFLNQLVINCTVIKRICGVTGWKENEYLHPNIQTSSSTIWRHILVDKKAHHANEIDKQLEIYKNALEEGKIWSLGILFAFSSILHYKIETNPFCLLITGLSGTGKTTLAKSICNLFYDTNKLEITMNTTQNALELIMHSLKDMTILVDEMALKANSTDMEKIVFMTFAKSGKARADKKLSVKLNELNSNLVITSEMCEIEQLKRTGALRRLLFLSVESRKDITEQYSTLLKSVNYTGGVKKFVEWLKNYQIEHALDFGKRNSSVFLNLNNIAFSFYTTLKVLEDFYGQQFDRLRDLLYEKIETQENIVSDKNDIVKSFLEKFYEFLAINAVKFSPESKTEQWGRKEDDSVLIMPRIFGSFCQQNDFHTDLLLNKLEEEGYLIRNSSKRKTQNIRINGVVAKVLKIKLSNT